MQKFVEKIFLFEKYLLGYLLFQMLAVVFSATFFRYTALYSMFWGDEVARYTMIWLVAIGSGIGSYYGLHFNIDYFVTKLPLKLQKVCLCIQMIIIYVFCLFVMYYGVYLVKQQFKFGQISPALKIPMWFMYSAIPVLAAMVLLHYTGYSINLFKDLDKKIRKCEKEEKKGGYK